MLSHPDGRAGDAIFITLLQHLENYVTEYRPRVRQKHSPWEVHWTNTSVVKAMGEEGGADPVETITRRARQRVLEAMDHGWEGPPFDPLLLADHLGIEIVPRVDVDDAQTVPTGASRTRIEFNPNRPSGRVRYSIAHEIAHTLFADCTEQVRRRVRHSDAAGDEWQLEALCNVAAAEILMPFGSMEQSLSSSLAIEPLMDLQKQFQVSTEALLIRVVRLVDRPCAMFSASRVETGSRKGRYRLDYVIASQAWLLPKGRGSFLPTNTVLSECKSIGFTTIADETWNEGLGEFHIEAVGIPPFPGSAHPRIAGIVTPAVSSGAAAEPTIRYVRGSALDPRGTGNRIVVHVVNDKTPNWGGGGFAQALRSKWPSVQSDFQDWARARPQDFRLTAVRFCDAEPGVSVASIVAQKGYGASVGPRLRYESLRAGLEVVAREATALNATLHLPRLGAGQAGGSWPVIEGLIRAASSEAGVCATVYDLPGAPLPTEAGQRELRFR